ncbi:Uma2 family endonuclease [Butyrivibrio sp. AC2005]|uniref:Uma2 family endonuclease n=1 Tax=Butyrivibrio sp. AC2005 TaxID=1280672 RepID=UPI000677EB3E|nr:Uma2 family endonuclease [Butyrivibrio sp. AC2005]
MKCLFTKEGKCKVYESPIDIQLDRDDKTMVEPDVVVICERDIIRRKNVFGAPDFILEVLSKSTRRKDMLLKSYKYIEAGVREYWMIDPDKKLLIKYDCSKEDAIPEIKPLKGKEPVLIYDGKLEIDLDEIEAIIDEYEQIPEE